ncbi:hypothetical protein HU830_01510 [Lactobacillus sp. DCY120]|uniref:HPr kinase n=1 Tax=Bombilactobacillus apium TaxID=2675299 RepID=A0A850R5J8_9LACO|nr:hypothetical protein [Bombilactobacillus apium]NVY95882.1 hypothetical protein [Bombilactobacillus apium]
MDIEEMIENIRNEFSSIENNAHISLKLTNDINKIIAPNAELIGINEVCSVWSDQKFVYFDYGHSIRKQSESLLELYYDETLNDQVDVMYGLLRGGVTELVRQKILENAVWGIHASLVRNPQTNRAVLFIGPKGSGKTSSALNLVANGWELLTDEFVAISEDGTIQALSRCPGIYMRDLKKFHPEFLKKSWIKSKSVINSEAKVLLNLQTPKFSTLSISQVKCFCLLSREQVTSTLNPVYLKSQFVKGKCFKYKLGMSIFKEILNDSVGYKASDDFHKLVEVRL